MSKYGPMYESFKEMIESVEYIRLSAHKRTEIQMAAPSDLVIHAQQLVQTVGLGSALDLGGFLIRNFRRTVYGFAEPKDMDRFIERHKAKELFWFEQPYSMPAYEGDPYSEVGVWKQITPQPIVQVRTDGM